MSLTIEPKLNPKNIIIRMPNWLGDAVMASPVLKIIRNAWPNASITAMCQKPCGLLFENDPNIDHILHFSKPKKWYDFKSHKKILQETDLEKAVDDLKSLETKLESGCC
ncbi:hypothetical protein SCG7109_AB_00020 [Chlamydiales bacterium SCGC AG-110-M15]|nr:hypothetical protein SCG7109_AB_00020 [Chlamydiales bacterium SCGC AG-110-M15]